MSNKFGVVSRIKRSLSSLDTLYANLIDCYEYLDQPLSEFPKKHLYDLITLEDLVRKQVLETIKYIGEE